MHTRLASHAGEPSLGPADADGGSESGEEQGLAAKFSEAFTTFQETGSINAIVSVLADGVLDLIEVRVVRNVF